MSKRFFVSVNCVNEFASDTPESFMVEIDSALSSRIKQLASAVKDLDIHAVEEFNYAGTWSKTPIALLDGLTDGPDISQAIELVELSSARVEVERLRVTSSGFFFISVPKHSGDDMALSTKKIDLSKLDGPESVIVIR